MRRISSQGQPDTQSTALSELPDDQALREWLLGKLTSSSHFSPMWDRNCSHQHLCGLASWECTILLPWILKVCHLWFSPYVTHGVNFSSQEITPPTHLTVSALGPSSVQPSVTGDRHQQSSLSLCERLLLGLFPQRKQGLGHAQMCNRWTVSWMNEWPPCASALRYTDQVSLCLPLKF